MLPILIQNDSDTNQQL